MTDFIKVLMEAGQNMSDNQKGVLVTIAASATPQQAFDAINTSQLGGATRNELIKMGLVQQQGNAVALTSAGQAALVSNNLIDETGKLTQEGQSQLNDFNNNQREYVNLESFNLFQSFYQ